jgi:hypothetical protein
MTFIFFHSYNSIFQAPQRWSSEKTEQKELSLILWLSHRILNKRKCRIYKQRHFDVALWSFGWGVHSSTEDIPLQNLKHWIGYSMQITCIWRRKTFLFYKYSFSPFFFSGRQVSIGCDLGSPSVVRDLLSQEWGSSSLAQIKQKKPRLKLSILQDPPSPMLCSFHLDYSCPLELVAGGWNDAGY